jgi:hypothetical protein
VGHPLPCSIREHGLQGLQIGMNVTEKSKTHGKKPLGQDKMPRVAKLSSPNLHCDKRTLASFGPDA